MKSLLTLLLALGTVLTSPTHAQSVSLKREALEAGKEGTSLARISFPGGYLDYQGTPDPSDPDRLEKSLFGLSFHRPERSNGGWDLWRFLSVWVRSEALGKSLEVTGSYLLEDAQILEDETRRLFEFRWKIGDEGEVVATFLQYPAQADWLFVRIESQGIAMERVQFSCYPGNTTGPKERERWVATGNEQFQLDRTQRELASFPEGLVFFNRMAQHDTGCLLVAEGDSVETTHVSGGYATQARFDLLPGTMFFHAALGGFDRKNTEEIARVFAMEGARNLLHTLKAVDWTPKLDLTAHQRLFRDLAALVKEVGTPEEKQQFDSLSARYRSATGEGNIPVIRENVSEARTLSTALVSRALQRWK